MKKFIVLAVLFILPIVVYLFFASGVNNFAKLPELTENINDVQDFETLSGGKVTFGGKITILSFFGDDAGHKKTSALNLNEKIYKRFNGFEDFQLVAVFPKDSESDAGKLKSELSFLTDTSNWNFVFGDKNQIHSLFNSLKTNFKLDPDLSTPYVFIIDKNLKLRGRDDDEDALGGMLYGYNTTSVAEINNKMIDDIKVVLAEYRMALKSNDKEGADKRDSYLKKVDKR
ncbi:hypothetical protein MQE36_02635 [Zhouia spongiae]|uniref:Redoxin domain-containing protein n=1 Tax=Zhouia spongiae TaxID=2202721 RepID=A0ABY3YNI5_9FLAO|nr:hypothetical protein [Zhouia spongiae]UNY99251.1 hypothetical protein MQE36_02635 [Zhouia spongiae]